VQYARGNKTPIDRAFVGVKIKLYDQNVGYVANMAALLREILCENMCCN
jgi:hypothetical protein